MVDARDYHERTKHTPASVRSRAAPLDPTNRPRPDKRYLEIDRIDLEHIRPTQAPALSTVAQPSVDPYPNEEAQPMSRIDLATLCYEANGIVQRVEHDGQEMLFRAASCTGKLYHIDLYLVCGDIEGLDAGVYHFDPTSFSLDVLRQGDFRGVVAEAIGSRDIGVSEAPVSVILTSTWWRNAWKYRDRTYRHAFWDGGTVIANLLASAHGQGHRAGVVAGFVDDELTRLLGIDPATEAPISVVPIGEGAPVESAPSMSPITYETAPLSRDPIDYPLIVEAWEQSRLPDGAAVNEWVSSANRDDRIGRIVDKSTESVNLEPVDHETASARPLHATIRRRGSKRSFLDDGPTLAKVGTVLDRSLVGVPADWNDGDATGLTFNDSYLLATGIDGLDDGSYRVSPSASVVERIGDIDRDTKTHLALGQGYAGEAQANVYLMTHLDDVVGRLGNRGYRAAQLEAGITLGRLYLAAAAHRTLGGTGLTFFDDLVTDTLSPVAAEQTPTTLFGFGRIDR